MKIQPPLLPNQPKVRTFERDGHKLRFVTRELEAVREQDRSVANHQRVPQNTALQEAAKLLLGFPFKQDISAFMPNETEPRDRFNRVSEEDLTPAAAATRREKIDKLEHKKEKIETRLNAAKRLDKSLTKTQDDIKHGRHIHDEAIADFFLAEESQFQEVQEKHEALKPQMENIFAQRH